VTEWEIGGKIALDSGVTNQVKRSRGVPPRISSEVLQVFSNNPSVIDKHPGVNIKDERGPSISFALARTVYQIMMGHTFTYWSY